MAPSRSFDRAILTEIVACYYLLQRLGRIEVAGLELLALHPGALLRRGIPFGIPYGPVQLNWRETDLLCLAIDPQKDRLLGAVDVHSHQYAVAPGPGKGGLIAANLPVWAAGPPVLLEPVKAICLVAFRMLLPIGVVVPNAVGF